MTGTMFAIVGPSGVGKDSILEGIVAARPDLHLVRRVITRAPELGGEVFDPVTIPVFDRMAQNGAFAVHWGAHGLRYGIPASAVDITAQGTDCLANFSRGALLDGAAKFPKFRVLSITAHPQTLSARLAARGRESLDEIAGRLAQATRPLPDGLDVRTITNDGTLPDAVDAALTALQPESV